MALSKIQTTEMLDTSNLGRRNLMINGDMRVAQRGTSTAGLTGAGYHTVDRIHFAINNAGTWTLSQEVDAPAGSGLVYSHKAQCTTANTSLTGSEYVLFQQRIEGQNLQHLEWNTSATKKVTLSFWFKSSKTGTYTCEFIQPGSGTSVYNGQQITVSSANTWTKYELTYDGQPSSIGTPILNTVGIGLYFLLWYGAGTSSYQSGTFNSNTWHSTSANRAVGNTNGADSTSNNFYITGLQLEVGDTASDFEHLTYSEQLSLCQRYYEQGNFSWRQSGSIIRIGQSYHTRKRANASVNVYYDSSKPAAGTINVGNSTNSGWNEGGNTNFWNMEKNTGVNSDSVDYNCFWTAEAEL